MTQIISAPIPEPDAGPKRRAPRWSAPVSFYGLSVYSIYWLAIILAVLPTVAKAQGNILSGCATSFDPARDYFPEKATVDLATDFRLTYFKYYKVLYNVRANVTYVLYQCGTQIPPGFDNVRKFAVPVTSVGVGTTTDIPFLELLSKRSAIKISGGLSLVTSPCVRAKAAAGAIVDLSSNDTIAESQLATVDVYFNGARFHEKTVTVSATSDPGALHRAEWLDFYAAFFNLEKSSASVYNTVIERYYCQSVNSGNITTTRPLVAWFNYDAPASYNGFKPSWSISTSAYKKDLVLVAGGRFFAPTTTYFLQQADFLAAVSDVDIVIDETYLANTNADFLRNFGLTSTSTLKFVANNNVWRFDRIQNEYGSLDWYESSIVQPDAVGQDLGSIFYPTGSTHTRQWFRRVSTNEGITTPTVASCVSVDAILPLVADSCTIIYHSSASILAPMLALAVAVVATAFSTAF